MFKHNRIASRLVRFLASSLLVIVVFSQSACNLSELLTGLALAQDAIYIAGDAIVLVSSLSSVKGDNQYLTTATAEERYTGTYTGEIPAGTYLLKDGKLGGTPVASGHYQYFIYDESSQKYSEKKAYVAQKSTNPDCPLPTDTELDNIYFCVGILHEDQLIGSADSDSSYYNLDVNYYINPDKANELAVNEISLTITFDPAVFTLASATPDFSDVTSSMYYMHTTRWTTSAPGKITITLSDTETETVPEATNELFTVPGRLLYVPLKRIGDTTEASSDISVRVNQIGSADDSVDLPEPLEVDGSILFDGQDSDDQYIYDADFSAGS